MKQLKQLLLVMAIALTGFTPAQAQTTPFNHYSEWIANSRNFYVYNGSSYSNFSSTDGNNGDYWRYDDGLMYEAILDTYHRYNTNTSFLEGVQSYLKWCFQKDKSPYIGKLKEEDLDDMRPGRLVWKYVKTYGHTDSNVTSTKYNDALTALMGSTAFSSSSRVTINGNTGKGYPWQHKESTAHQVWLDGIFMGIPFWTLAGPVIGSGNYTSWTEQDFFDDAVNQIIKTDEQTYEPTMGLWAHAWDADWNTNKGQSWSKKDDNFKTGTYVPPHVDEELVVHEGRSSHCWGRALGWYAMAIMETMDNIRLKNTSGTYNTQINTLKSLFKKVIDKVIETRDPSTGVWYCVLDVGDNSSETSPYYGKGPKNNYLEATCSSMFAYCLLHGVAQGYLNNSYKTIAQDVYNSVITKFVKPDSNNKKKLIDCDKVAGLGGTSEVGGTKYNRDGSFAYYMLESKIENDSKGIGPLIWASLAAETTPYNYTITTGFPTIASDGIVQFRWSRVADDFTVPNTTPANFESPTFTAKTYGGTTFDNATSIDFNSDNEAVATVDANGKITLAGEAGTANIKATMKSGAGAYVGEAIYTVTTTGTDTTKPTLSSSTPATGATDVAVSGNIVLTFSEAVTIADASKFTLTGGAGTLNTAGATVSGATITIPYSGLANSTTYTLNIAADAVKDLADNTNEVVNAITFTTIAPDLTAPSLSGHSITDGATDVATSGTIVLTFSEDVACATNATLTTTGSSAISLTPSVSGSTVTYSYSGLSNSTNYTFNLADNSVTDLAGNKYASAISFSFTTKAASAQECLFTVTSPSSNSDTQNNVTVSSGNNIASKTFNGTSGTAVYKIDSSNPINITSTTANINKISFTACNNSSGTSVAKTCKVSVSTDGSTYETLSSGVTVSGGTGTSSTSTAGIYISGYDGATTVTVEFEDYYRYIRIERDGKETWVNNLNVYGSTGSTPTTYTLTNTVNEAGYGTVSPASVSGIASGTAVTAGTGDNINKYTVGETTVTATPATATAEYTYAFSGWSNLPSTVKANTTVKANFTRTANSYTLAWNKNAEDADDLTGNYTNGSTAYGTTLTPPSTPTRSGYTFNGWNSAQDGKGTALGETMPAANTTYYAQWTENTPVVEQVATPSITGTTPFTDNTTVTITCATSDANIYYTTNGDTPTSSCTHYTAPFSIDATTTIKAIAIKSGMTDSEVASATFTKSGGGGGTSATITYNLDVGTTASTTIKNSTSTTDATNITNIDIDQAHDGANGTGASDRTTKLAIKTGNNGETFENPTNYELFKFTIATGKQFTPSEIAIKVANVGSSSANKVKYKATLTDESSHSIDGTYVVTTGNGTVEDFKFSNSSNVAFTGNVTLKLWAWTTTSTENNASAFRMGTPLTITGTIEDSSEPIIPTYTVTATSNNNNWGTVSVDKATAAEGATVTITTSPASGYELTSLTATDGESNPVTITNNQFTMPASNVTVNATFAAMEKVATPSITGTTPFTDNTTVTITCATTGATIHYTTDDSAPTSSSATYSEPINISATTTVKAIAVKEGMTDSEVASATFTKSGGGGGGSGTVLFSQDFKDATEVAYAASTARTITTGSDNNIVGTDSKTQFSYIGMTEKIGAGIAINSTTGGNSVNATGFFQAYCNATGQNWALVHNTDFADTAPTALKIDMKIYFQQLSSGSDYSVSFAVGDNFENGTSSPTSANVHSGFSILNNSTAKLSQYLTKTVIYDTGITQGEWQDVTWIINNNGEVLTYTDPKGKSSTVNNDCFDLWIGTTKVATNQAATTATTALQNLYIGDPAGKKNEFRLDEIVVTDLSPAAMRTTTATIKAGKQYATFNTTMDIDFDETDGLQAFVVDNATKSSVHLTEVTVVPANTALIIKGAPNTYTLYETKKATESVSDNQLIISNSTVAADNKYYALGTVNGVQGFHRVQNGLTIPTSYVIITDQTAKSFLNFEEEENIATGIDGFATDNGFIVIDDNTPLYNLSGQRVSKSYKGIVIVNGKKVLRK